MGLFTKKEDKSKLNSSSFAELPELPELPQLPELPKLDSRSPDMKNLPSLPKIDSDFSDIKTSSLPSLPKNSFNDKFSQKALKEAINGEKEEDEVFEEIQKPHYNPVSYEEELPLIKESESFTKRRSYPIQREFLRTSKKTKEAEPVFIRIDKFQESLNLFEKTKDKISEIEKLLREIQILKAQEEQELDRWEKELQEVKNQIERVNQDIFSKVD